MKDNLREQVLGAWIKLNGLLKDSQMTDELTYNESVVLKCIYDRYRADGVGKTPVQDILKETRMLKSLMNRTINSLYEQGYISREKDGRNLFLTLRSEKVEDFLKIHNASLAMVDSIVEIIGEADARVFVSIAERLSEVATPSELISKTE